MTDAPRETLDAFARRVGLTMTVTLKWRANTSHAIKSGGAVRGNMDAWHCKVRHPNGATMAIPFYKGTGHGGAEPALPDVLYCLASDSSSYDNARSFSEWASDFGMDDDSRTAEKLYRQCGRQSVELMRLLGATEYDNLLYNTESL